MDDDDDVYDNDHDNTNYRQPNDNNNDDDNNAADDEEVLDEYASAKKLVQRAADREALLKLFKKRSSSSSVVATAVDTAAKNEASGITASSSSSSFVGGNNNNGSDFSSLPLKSDHFSRPCWTCPNGIIYLEAFHPLYATAYDFLVAIAEPIRRPEYIHEYQLTPYSLYAAVATNIDTEAIVRTLNRFSKNVLPDGVAIFIRECTKRYGKAKLVLKHNRYYVESDHPEVLRELLRDEAISQARVVVEGEDSPTTALAAAAAAAAGGSASGGQIMGGKIVGATGSATNVVNAEGFIVHTKAQEMEENLRMLHELDGNSTEEEDEEEQEEEEGDDGAIGIAEGRVGGGSSLSSSKSRKTARQASSNTTVSFQIMGDSVEIVKRRAIE